MEEKLEQNREKNTESKAGRVRKKFTSVMVLHFIRLIYRSILFLLLAGVYVTYRINEEMHLDLNMKGGTVILWLVWFVFIVEMIFRFFPSRIESPGSQKQFEENYIKTGETDVRIPDNNATMLVAFLWVFPNAIIGALYMADIFDEGIMILLSCAYSVCDMICILFFCPFQTWFLKNKCCGSCRIYNWDYAMMFTPLFFVRTAYTWSLLFVSLLLLLRWEITFYRYPERFSENTNNYLSCEKCTEKLCVHKKQLHTLWKDVSRLAVEKRKKLSHE